MIARFQAGQTAFCGHGRIPIEGFCGNHIYVTEGKSLSIITIILVASDYWRTIVRLWSSRYAGWDCVIKKIDFDLLDTAELNGRKMIGREQYLHDPVLRARRFIERISHDR